MTSRIIVVGAGIFGVAAALELQHRGHQVVLVDPGPLPHPEASSTDISKVIRMDYGADEFTMALMEESLKGWHRWNDDWQVPLYHQVGFVLLTHKRMETGSFEGDSYRLLQKRGHRPERLDPDSIAERFPQWSKAGYVDGYFNPEAGWAESGRVVATLLTQAQAAGVELAVGEPVLELLARDGQSPGVRTRQGLIRGDGLVLAAGAWSPSLLPELRDKVWPVGQPVMHFKVSEVPAFQPPEFVPWASDIEETGWYGFPAKDDGTLKMANHGPGRRMMPGVEAQIRPEDEKLFREFTRRNLPSVTGAARLSSRVCFYSDSWDGDFYIDRVPDRPGLVVATGGSGHGFKFAPVLGQLIADAVEGINNHHLSRYRWREAETRRTEQARHM